jgi:hypothetical protein
LVDSEPSLIILGSVIHPKAKVSLPWTQAGLRFVAVQNLICFEQIKLAMALLKHVDTWQSPSRSHESLLHTGWIDSITAMQHTTMFQQTPKSADTNDYISVLISNLLQSICIIMSNSYLKKNISCKNY